MASTSETSGQKHIVLTDLGDGVFEIRMNRPEKHNALNSRARADFAAALQSTEGQARVVIVCGAGRSFCAGMDLTEFGGVGSAQSDALNRSWREVQDLIRRHPAVVIASAQGHALGGGATLINTCDLAVVADDVRIGLPEITFGHYSGIGAPAAQLRVSAKRAAWLVLTGKRIDGPTAVEWGMANLSVPAAELAGSTLRLAREIAAFDAVALEWSKKALWQIPMQIGEWRAALEFGDYVNSQIQSRGSAHLAALDAFAHGGPGKRADS